MKILVNIKDKLIKVNCGEGSQPIQWLLDNGVYLYDNNFGINLSNAIGVKNEIGRQMGLNDQINEVLSDNQQVFIILEDEFSNIKNNKTIKKKR